MQESPLLFDLILPHKIKNQKACLCELQYLVTRNQMHLEVVQFI